MPQTKAVPHWGQVCPSVGRGVIDFFLTRFGSVYYLHMPVGPILSAIVSSVIGSVVEGVLTAAPEEASTGIVRMLPEESRTGSMLPPDGWEVQINGKIYPISPGLQIRNELNMIILPSMVQDLVKVRFVVDPSGAVHRVWILSAAEAKLSENP